MLISRLQLSAAAIVAGGTLLISTLDMKGARDLPRKTETLLGISQKGEDIFTI